MLVRQKLVVSGSEKSLRQMFDALLVAAAKEGYKAEDVHDLSGQGRRAIRITLPNGKPLFVDFELGKLVTQIWVWCGPLESKKEDKQWNQDLRKFTKSVVQPLAKKHGVNASLTPDEEDLEDWFSRDVARLLRNAMAAPPHTTERFRAWTEFVVKAALESGEKYDDELVRWLEDLGEKDESIERMLGDYHKAHWILSEYFRQFPQHKPVNPNKPD